MQSDYTSGFPEEIFKEVIHKENLKRIIHNHKRIVLLYVFLQFCILCLIVFHVFFKGWSGCRIQIESADSVSTPSLEKQDNLEIQATQYKKLEKLKTYSETKLSYYPTVTIPLSH